MAGTAYRDEGGDSISEINVTPLVDVMLVLLVIFMVTAPLLAARGIVINTPTTVAGQPAMSPLEVSLDRERALRINGAVMAAEGDALAEISRLVTRDPERKATITVDAEVPYGEAMKVVDLVKRGGGAKLVLKTRRPRPEP